MAYECLKGSWFKVARWIAGWLLLFSAAIALTIEQEPSVYQLPSLPPPKSSSLPSSTSPSPAPLSPSSEATIESGEKAFYISIETVPSKLYVHQIFPISLKVVALHPERGYEIKLEGGNGLQVVERNTTTSYRPITHFLYHFKALAPTVKLPNFVISCHGCTRRYQSSTKTIQAITLNPPKNFCGILAKHLKLVNFQASAYDESRNIVALELRIHYGNVEDFHLPGSLEQGSDALIGDLNQTTLLYYAVFPKKMASIAFSYFNIDRNRYETFQVPIIVKRSRVSTATDLDPRESEFTRFKIGATSALIAFWILMWIKRRRWRYPLYIAIGVSYLVTYVIPLQKVCAKKGATLYLLPTPQSTPFATLSQRTDITKMQKTEHYTKVQLPNHRIGWIKNEDLCTP